MIWNEKVMPVGSLGFETGILQLFNLVKFLASRAPTRMRDRRARANLRFYSSTRAPGRRERVDVWMQMWNAQ